MSFRRQSSRVLAVVAAVMWASTPEVGAQTTRVSVDSTGAECQWGGRPEAMSADGSVVYFRSSCTTLTPEAQGGTFAYNRVTHDVRWLGAIGPVTSDGTRTLESPATVRHLASGTSVGLPYVTHVPWARFTGDSKHLVYFTDGSPGRYGFATRLRVADFAGGVCEAHASSAGDIGNVPFPFDQLLLQPDGSASFSDDGRWVTYASSSTNLVPGDTNGRQDVFLHDCATGVTTRVSVDEAGGQADADSSDPVISGDGRYIAFESRASNLPGRGGLYIRDRVAGTLERLAFTPDTFGGSYFLNRDGRFLFVSRVTTGVYDRERGFVAPIGVDRVGHDVAAHTFFASADGRYAVFSSDVDTLVAGDTNGQGDVFVRDLGDFDNDGMPTTWESLYGLDPADAADASADPDGDGRTNLQEFNAGTHPRGVHRRLLAEGAGGFFETLLSLANPDTSASVTYAVHARTPEGAVRSHAATLPAGQFTTLDVSAFTGVGGAFAMDVESSSPIGVERQMFWPAGVRYGSHLDSGVPSAQPRWYFAEGATGGGFDLFYLLQNPGTDTALVDITYITAEGTTVVRTYAVPATSRLTVWVDMVPELAAAEVAAQIDVRSGPPIVVERAMYLSTPTQRFAAGHDSSGVSAPSLDWFFAEGATGAYFDCFLLLENPGSTTATVEVRYLLPDGREVVKVYDVEARHRRTLWVDVDDPRLADASFSAELHVRNGVPIVAERTMWWPGPGAGTWHEAHNSPGATTTSNRWLVARASTRFGVSPSTAPPADGDTFLLIANRSTALAHVRLTASSGSSLDLTLLPRSRYNVDISNGDLCSSDCSILVEGVDATPASLVVESAVYSDAGGVRWAAGGVTLATALP